MVWDRILAELSVFVDFCALEFARRDGVDWFLFFFPVLFFFEIPRYYLPLFIVMFLRWLGLPRIDQRAREAFLRRAPFVSVVVAGRNESAAIARCIQSLLDQEYSNYEIIVIDDSSDDDMYSIAKRYARKGQIRLLKNAARRGRSGRPSATNLGLRLSRGEIVISLDADTTFDPQMIRSMVAGFADPRVGVVAGSILPGNNGRNMLTRVQTIEYLMGIDLNKRWTSMWGGTLSASGALGAFRRQAVVDVGGWDPELAEDADVSLRMIKAGWRVAFAPEAIAFTEVPSSLGVLARQRARWDRGGLRTFFRKHIRLMNPLVFRNWPVAFELASEGFFFVLCTFLFPVYVVWLWIQDPFLFLFVMGVSAIAYTALSLLALIPIRVVSERCPPLAKLIVPGMLLPVYKEWLRWVRLRAFLSELFLVRMEDPYLPRSAWAHTPWF